MSTPSSSPAAVLPRGLARLALTAATVAVAAVSLACTRVTAQPSPSSLAPTASTVRNAPMAAEAAPAPFTVRVVGTGRPVLLIPGLMSGPDVWDATVAHLERGHTLHVVHLAGFAGAPAAPGADFLGRVRDGLLAYVADMRARGLERPVIVGHSLGGFLAYAVASAQPDAVAGVVAVDGLPFFAALGDPAATPESVGPTAAAMRGMFAGLSPEQLAAQTRPGLPTLMRDTANVARAVEWARTSDPATVGQAMAEMLTTDLRPAVAAIRAPVLQIVAAGSAPTAEVRAMLRDRYAAQVASVPRHEVIVAERAYHFVMLDDPAFFHATRPGTPPAPRPRSSQCRA